MAIFGIGAYYDNDVSGIFIEKELACIGWSEETTSALYNILRSIKVGDIIYIKSQPPQIGLIIKAVGLVVDNEVLFHEGIGAGVKMKWIWTGNEKLGRIKALDDKYNVRNNSIYEEFNRFVQNKVVQLLLGR